MLLAIGLGLPMMAAADTIALKSAAMVEADAPITLAHIAELEGPKAVALGGVVIAQRFEEISAANANANASTQPNTAWAMVDIERVRAILLKRDDVAWAQVELSGSSVTIRPSAVRAEAPKVAAAAPTPRAAEPIDGGATSIETVRGQVVAKIAEELRATVDDLRLTFENADARLLETTLAGRTAVVQVLGAGAKVPVSVRVLEGDRTVIAGTVRVGTLVRTRVGVATRAIARNEVVEEGVFSVEDRWIAPGQDVAALSRLVGSVARQRVNAGSIVRDADLDAPTVVSKGDVVAVDCLAGSVVVTQRARALGDAKLGEIVEFESLSPKQELSEAKGGKVRVKSGPKSKFRARVDGRGRAVAIAAGTDGDAGGTLARGDGPTSAAVVEATPTTSTGDSSLGVAPDVVEQPSAEPKPKPTGRKPALKFFPIKEGR